MSRYSVFFSLMAALAAPLAADEPLSLEAYLGQVSQDNRALKAARAMDAALRLGALEPRVALSPYLTAQAGYFDDQAEPTMPFGAKRTTATQIEASLSKQLEWTGTRLSLGFKEGSTALSLQPGLFGPGSNSEPYYALANGVSVSLAQPLLKDFGARSYKILQKKVDATLASARQLNGWGAGAIMFDAESSYLSLASLQEVGRLLEESLERNNKILKWTQDKFADDLADKVDVLQVQAAVKQVEAGLVQTRSEAARAGERFNLLRGRPAAEAVDALSLPSTPQDLDEPRGERLDLKAAALDLKAKDAQVEEVVERFMPDLSLFGSATGTGTETGLSPGAAPDASKAWSFDHPTYLVGVKLSTTLDLPLYYKVKAGAEAAAGQGREALEQKRQSTAQEWAALKGQWQALQEQLKLAEELEAIQKEKAEREKKRYLDGRTTNFQVLRFEEDYNQARIAGLRLRAAALALAAQARFFNREGL